jgi:hypothetical protein
MSTAPSPAAASSSARPLRYLFVAGLGRREIGPPETVRPALGHVLKHIATSVPDAQPVALASGAAGADQVFLEAARALGWPIRLVLPVAAYLFEKDFTKKDASGATVEDTDALATFRRLRDAAIDTEIIPSAPGRHAAFARTAEELIRRADVVVALWDGVPGAAGGTSESLTFVAAEKKPLLLLSAKDGTRFGPAPAWEPKELQAAVAARHDTGILRDIAAALKNAPLKEGRTALQRLAAAEAARSGSPGAAAETLEEILEDVLKSGARTMSDEHRSRNTWVLGLHLLATSVGLLGLAFFAGEPHGLAADVVALAKLVFVVWAFWLIRRVHRERKHLGWSRARYVREVGRSLSRTAPVSARLGESVGAFVPPSLWSVFARLRLPLTTFYALGQPVRRSRVADLDAVMAEYGKLAFEPEPWIAKNGEKQTSQFRYMGDQGRTASDRRHRVHGWVNACLALMLVAAALALVLPLCGAPHTYVLVAKFASVLMPVLAASLLVLPNLNDWNRRATVDSSVAEFLQARGAQLAALRELLRNPTATALAWAENTPVWRESVVGAATDPDHAAKVRAAVEAMVANRFAAIVVESETAILTELIGFKTFVESVELA